MVGLLLDGLVACPTSESIPEAAGGSLGKLGRGAMRSAVLRLAVSDELNQSLELPKPRIATLINPKMASALPTHALRSTFVPCGDGLPAIAFRLLVLLIDCKRHLSFQFIRIGALP